MVAGLAQLAEHRTCNNITLIEHIMIDPEKLKMLLSDKGRNLDATEGDRWIGHFGFDSFLRIDELTYALIDLFKETSIE